MRIIIIICFLFTSILGSSQNVLKEIESLSSEISKLDTITFEQQLDYDNRIMELQFDKINQLFEDLRDDLSSKKIAEPSTVEVDGLVAPYYYTDSIEDINAITDDHKEALVALGLRVSGSNLDQIKRIIKELTRRGLR
jgi:hypothetical protein